MSVSAARGRLATRSLACLAAALAPCASLALASDARERGLRLAGEGRCDAALEELAAAREETPGDVELLRMTGLCELRLHRYAEASKTLEAAVAAAPGRADLALELAKARFHAGDLAGADQALRGATALESDAEYQLYLGMLRLEQGDAAAAVAALSRARELDAKRVDPVASYYLGIALSQTRDNARARQMLAGVRDSWTGTDWGSEAGRQLARLERQDARLAFASLGAGVEYDDNVVLRGRGVPLPSDIRGESDVAGIWSARAGVELWKRDEVVLGLMGGYRGVTYTELDEFDSHFPNGTLWLEGPLAESLRGRLRYDFGYAWQQGDPFVVTNELLGALERDWPRFGTTAFYVQGAVDEYFFRSDDVAAGDGSPGSVCPPSTPSDDPCGPPGLNERSARDRDGGGFATGFDHTLPVATGSLPLRDTTLLAGFRYANFESQGREYDFDAYDFHGGFGTTLPAAVELDVVAGFTLRPYRHSTTFPDPDDVVDGEQYGLPNTRKREKTTRVELALSRDFGEHVTLGTHFRYLDNASSVDVFDYDQYAVGVTLTLTFAKEL